MHTYGARFELTVPSPDIFQHLPAIMATSQGVCVSSFSWSCASLCCPWSDTMVKTNEEMVTRQGRQEELEEYGDIEERLMLSVKNPPVVGPTWSRAAYIIRIRLSHCCLKGLISVLYHCLHVLMPTTVGPHLYLGLYWYITNCLSCVSCFWGLCLDYCVHLLAWCLVSHDRLSLYELFCCTYRPCLLMLHGIPYIPITDSYCTWFAVLWLLVW